MYKIIGFLFGVLFFTSNIQGQDFLLEILDNELKREFDCLSKEEIPVYYMDYRLDELNSYSVSSSFGSLVGSNEYKTRVLTASVRLGDYSFDNTHVSDDYYGGSRHGYNFSLIPSDNDSYAIKNEIWQLTDRTYKSALSSYKIAHEKQQNSEELLEEIPDFSKEQMVQYIEEPKEILSQFNKNEWEKRLKSYTAPFIQDMSILTAEAHFTYNTNRKYFISSEGAKITQNFSYVQIHIWANIKSEDGDIVPFTKSFYARTLEGLPDHEVILKEVHDLKDKLQQLKTASIAEPYTGAILSAKSAGVFFHEIFGHRIEADRMKFKFDGQTFKEMIGKSILSKDFSVVFDPSISKFNEIDLLGHYKYDDQGVKGERVEIVEHGILNEFLKSRTPITSTGKSNGHGRAQGGSLVVSRQSNMFIETTSEYSDDDLRKMLIKECKKQKKEYGYYFKEVIGGFTSTNRYIPNVFNIIPIEVYRIFVDGRPDELVRGVDLIGTPLTVFSMIKAAGENSDVFNGFCGAESGSIPVSTIAPPLFVKQIETQLKPNSKVELPILSRPGINNKLAK